MLDIILNLLIIALLGIDFAYNETRIAMKNNATTPQTGGHLLDEIIAEGSNLVCTACGTTSALKSVMQGEQQVFAANLAANLAATGRDQPDNKPSTLKSTLTTKEVIMPKVAKFHDLEGPAQHQLVCLIADSIRQQSTLTGKQTAAEAATKAFRAGLAAFDAADAAPAEEPLQIGAPLDGGIYAGMTTVDGKLARLVLMLGEMLDVDWKESMAWAKGSDGALPTRAEQLTLFKNLKAEFEPRWYWSCELRAGNPAYAWFQYFNGGNQYCNRKSHSGAARLVRRLIIQ